MAKRESTIKKIELVKQLNWLERKNKKNQSWDSHVKLAFNTSGSYSFEELVQKDIFIAEDLVENFK